MWRRDGIVVSCRSIRIGEVFSILLIFWGGGRGR